MRAIRSSRFGRGAPCRMLATLMIIGLAGSAVRAQLDLFEWTLSSPTGSGGGAVLGDQMRILGPDSFRPCPGGSTNSFTTVAPYGLTITGSYHAVNFDEWGPGFDFVVAIVDGVETVIDENGTCSNCEILLEVPAGSTFGFGVQSADCAYGPAMVTIHDVHVEPTNHVILMPGAEKSEAFGTALAAVGDVDSDGSPDVLIGAPFADAGGVDSGRVAVHSSLTGLPILEIAGPVALARIGSAASAGDIDADGVDDLIVGAPFAASLIPPGAVYVYSGADATLLWQWTGPKLGDLFGWSVAVAGDVDLDGFNDVLVGAPQHNGSGLVDAGMARLMSGANGSVIASWGGAKAGDQLGFCVDGAGDVDGDGVLDVIAGAPTADGAWTDSGQAQVFSGWDGDLIHGLHGGGPGPGAGNFGWSVAGVGDLDVDGFADVAVGAPDDDEVWAFSGEDGGVLWLDHDESDFTANFGWVVTAAGDVDNDGHPDVAIGIPGAASGLSAVASTLVDSGENGVSLDMSLGHAADHYGAAIAGLGDIDLDGLCDLAVGLPEHDGVDTHSGGAILVRSAVLWTDLGEGLAGTLPAPQLTGQGLLAGGKLVVALAGAPAGAPVFLFVGLAALHAPFKSGVLVPKPDGIFVAVTDPDGSYHLKSAATGPLPTGQSYFFQAWIVDAGGPAGYTASSALRATVP